MMYHTAVFQIVKLLGEHLIGYSDDAPADIDRFDTQRIPMGQLVSCENL